MKILEISYHCCVRVVKEGLALYGDGNAVWFFQSMLANQDFKESFQAMSMYKSELDVEDPYKRYEHFAVKLGDLVYGVFGEKSGQPFDILHVHNEPDWMVPVANSVAPHIPLVFDCHDLDSARTGNISPLEREAVELADAFVLPSRSYEKHLEDTYGPDDRPKQVIYSMCLSSFSNIMPKPHIGGIVYEGGIGFELGVPKEANYRDYRDLARFLTGRGIPFFIYGVKDEFWYEYSRTGATIYPSQAYFRMMQDLQMYDWGLCGSPYKHPQWDMAMPNKLFEYISAGIPVLVCHADECAEFVKRYDVGVVLDDWEDIPKVYEQHRYYRRQVQKKKALFTMEKQLPYLYDLYRRAIEKKKLDAIKKSNSKLADELVEVMGLDDGYVPFN